MFWSGRFATNKKNNWNASEWISYTIWLLSNAWDIDIINYIINQLIDTYFSQNCPLNTPYFWPDVGSSVFNTMAAYSDHVTCFSQSALDPALAGLWLIEGP